MIRSPIPSHFDTSRLIVAAAAFFEAREVLTVFERKGLPITFIEVGVGAIKSGQIASRTVDLISNRTVVFIGSCGSSNEFTGPELINPTSVIWAPADVRRGESYLVPGAEKEISLRPISAKIAITKAQVSCSSSITLRNDSKQDVFENLELYSVATAWHDHCSAFYAILGVTNQFGPNAHTQWKENFSRVAAITANFIEQNFEAFEFALGKTHHGT